MKRLQAIVPEEFHRLVKVEATKDGKTVKELIVELLKQWLKEKGIEVD